MRFRTRTGFFSRALSLSKAEDLIFTKRRLSIYGYALLAANVGAFTLRSFAGKWLVDRAGHFNFTNFLQWWVGGQFALMRNAAGAYNYSTYFAAQALLAKPDPGVLYFHWVYPPTMLLLVAPIARLPYSAAFVAWVAATFCVYAAALYEILPDLLTIVLALLPLPVVKNIFDGQTAFLMAGLLGLSLVFIGRRPYLAGVCLGILTYKPQFLLFFPLALVVTGQWRVIVSAAASALLLAGAAALLFGASVWLLFLHSLQGHNSATLLPTGVDALNQTVLGVMHQAGAGVVASWTVHAAVALLMTTIACQI